MSKYFRYVCGGRNEHFLISLLYFMEKVCIALHCFLQSPPQKGTSWTLLITTNIWLRHLVQVYLKNNICFFRSPISLWRGPQLKSLFRAFFLGMVLIFTMEKISPYWGPLHAFLNVGLNFSKICFLKMWRKFIGAKSGSYSGQKCIYFCWGVFFDWETSIYFCALFALPETPLDALTNSALIKVT